MLKRYSMNNIGPRVDPFGTPHLESTDLFVTNIYMKFPTGWL